MLRTSGTMVWATLFFLASTAMAEQPPEETLPRGAFARLGTTRFHADEPIASVTLSPDGTRLAVADHDGRALLFDAATGRRLLRFEHIPNGDHSKSTRDQKMAFSRDGNLLARADGKWLSLHDTTTGKLLALLPCEPYLTYLSLWFTVDGRSLLLFDQNRESVLVIDLTTRRQTGEILVGENARQAAFSPNNNLLAVTYYHHSDTDKRNCVKLLNLETGKNSQPFSSKTFATLPALTPDGKVLVIQENSIFTFWDVASSKQLQRFAALNSSSGPITFSPDGKQLAARAGNNDIQVVATATGERLALYRGDESWELDSLAYTPDGTLSALGYRGNTAWLWKPGRQAPNLANGHHESIQTLKFEDEGRSLVSTDSANNPLLQRYAVANAFFERSVFTGTGSNRTEWNLKTGLVRRQPETGARGIMGREVLIQVEERPAIGLVRVWEPATTLEVWRSALDGIVRAQAILSPDGRLVALSTQGERNEKVKKADELCLWNIDTNKRLWRATTPDGWRQELLFSPDGKTLVAHSGGATVELRDANTGKIRQTLTLAKGETAGPLVFAVDGRTLYIGVRGANGAHPIRRWNTATWQQEEPLNSTGSRATALALSPDGQTLASGHSDSTILLWDLASRAKADLAVPPMKFTPDVAIESPPPSLSVASAEPLPRGVIQRLGTPRFRLSAAVTGATLSAEGRVIAATATDLDWWRPIVLLDAATGRVLRALPQVACHPTEMALSPDGKLFVYADSIGGNEEITTIVMDVATGQQLYKSTGSGVFVSFSGNGQRHTLAGIGKDKKLVLEVWDVKKQAKIQAFAYPFDGESAAGGLATSLSTDGSVLACWTTEKWERTGNSTDVLVFDVESGKRLRKIKAAGNILSAALSPDGKQVIVAEEGGSLSAWDVASGKLRFRAVAFLPHMPPACLAGTACLSWNVAGILYSPDGKRFAVWYDDVVEIRDAANGKPLSRRQVPEGKALSVAFLPGGEVRIVCAVEQVLYTIDGATGRPSAEAAGPQTSARELLFSHDGKTLSAFGGGVRRDWDVVTGKPLAAKLLDSLQPSLDRDYTSIRDTDPFLQISPDGKYALVHAWSGRQVIGIRSSVGIVDLERDVRLFDVLGSACRETTFATSERTAITADNKGKLYHWDFPSGRLRPFHPKTFEDGADLVALTGSRRVVAVLQSSHKIDGEPLRTVCDIRLRATATGKEIAQLQVERAGGSALFSPDETLLAFCGDDGVIDVWWANDGAPYRTMALAKVQVDQWAFSPDSRTLAIAVHELEEGSLEQSGGRIIVWELATGRMRHQFTSVDAPATALRFSPDGRVLASAHRDTTIVLWDVFAGEKKAVEKATPAQLRAWWTDLADVDAVRGLAAMRQLTARPAESVALIARNLPPGKSLTPAARDRLLADLDHDAFERREEASRQLWLAGRTIAPALRQALAAKPTIEQSRRLEELLEMLKRREPNPEVVRATRALEVLERINTPAAKQLLDELAKGDPDAPLTREAAATLKRLAAR